MKTYILKKDVEVKTKPSEDEGDFVGAYGSGQSVNVDFESGERQRLELEYFSKRGFWFDFGLIFKTIPAVLKHRGAH